jgi:hypothetical protein
VGILTLAAQVAYFGHPILELLYEQSKILGSH